MELLNVGMKEVVRNEALLLMIELTQDRKDGKLSKQIQQMVGFHSAFEKVFDIIKEEGLSDGSVIVEDCIKLAMHLHGTRCACEQIGRALRMVLGNHIFLTLTPAYDVRSNSASFHGCFSHRLRP